MSNHPRVEEVSDSDPDEVDLSNISSGPNAAVAAPDGSLINPANIPMATQLPGSAPLRLDREKMKDWHMLYPIYLDGTRTRAEGRMVSKDHAVENPLAREICDAVGSLGFRYAFEAGKTHPKDWANPGRVRVDIKNGGAAKNNHLKQYSLKHYLFHSGPKLTCEEHHLLIKVGDYLRAHPATSETPLKLKIMGMAADAKAPPPPAVPRGWKMGSILPLHSDAVSGGGVSENFFQDIQREMQGLGPASPAGNEGGGKPKKDKKKNKG